MKLHPSRQVARATYMSAVRSKVNAQRLRQWPIETNRAREADFGAAHYRSAFQIPLDRLLPPLASLEIFNRRIPTLSQCRIDPLKHDIVDFGPLIEGCLPQRIKKEA
jgi:hypothetical protein